MRAIKRGLLAGVLLLMGAAAASAQTVDEVIEKAIAAEGGREALAKVTSRSTKGTISVNTPGGEFGGPVEAVNQAPNKQRTLVTIDLSAAGMGNAVIDEGLLEGLDGGVAVRLEDQLGAVRGIR